MALNITTFDKTSVSDLICSFWGPFSDSQRKLVNEQLRISTYYKNKMIYQTFEFAEKMYILLSGKVKIYKHGVSGRYQIVRVVKPFDMFGYRAFFAHESHRTSATALETSIVATIPMETVLELMKTNTQISEHLLQQLAQQLGMSDDRTVNLTQKHIRGRLAEALLYLKETYGVQADGTTLNIVMNREDLASLSNMTTSNAIRTLSAFAAEQLVVIESKKIKIIQEDELRRISSLG